MDNQNNENIQTSVPTPNVTTNPSVVTPNVTHPIATNVGGPKEVIKEEVPVQVNTKKDNGIFNIDELLKAYIGPNYDKFLMKSFNIPAFLFTWIYYFFRKMTLYGIIILVIEGILGYFLMSMPYILLIINILCGLFTNKIYVRFAIKRINKYLVKYARYSTDYIKGICIMKGGRSIPRIFITLILVILLSIPVMFGILFLKSSDDFKTFISNFDIKNIKLPDIKIPSINIENKFDGYLMIDKKVNVLDEFKVGVPEVFSPTSNNSKYELEYSFKSNDRPLGTCTFSIKAVKGYSSAKTLINDIHDYLKDKNPSNVMENYTNKLFWNAFNYQKDNANVYYYGCNKGSKVFLFIYVDEINSTSSCHDYIGHILNEIVVK